MDFKPKFNAKTAISSQKNKQEVKDLVEAALAERNLIGNNANQQLCEAVF